MVTLRIIIEGGIHINGNVDVDTVNNVASLRQSLNKFFSRIISSDKVSIEIIIGTGYRAAAKRFAESESDVSLYVDSDLPAEAVDGWFDKLRNEENPEKSIIIPDSKREDIYFMIQEMEAWFLKQPECIDRWVAAADLIRKNPEEKICNHSLIRGKDIELIRKPSEKLAILIKKYVADEEGKAIKYGKLRTAPSLLDNLDVTSLLTKDAELRRFKSNHTV